MRIAALAGCLLAALLLADALAQTPAGDASLPTRVQLLVELLRNQLSAEQLRHDQLGKERADLAQPLPASAGPAQRAQRERRLAEIDQTLLDSAAALARIENELAQVEGRPIKPAGAIEPPGSDGEAVPAASEDVRVTAQGVELAPVTGPLFDDEPRQIQEALILVGGYDGRIDGKLGRRTAASIERFQERLGVRATGRLTPREQTALFEQADALRRDFQLMRLADPGTGVRLVYPSKLLPLERAAEDGRRQFLSADGASALRLGDAGPRDRLAGLFRELVERYQVNYSRLDDDWFVVTGTSGKRMVYDVARRTAERTVHVSLTYPMTEQASWDPFTVLLYNSFSAAPPG